MTRTRRRLLRSLGVGLAGVAGCLGGSGDGGAGEDRNGAVTGTPTAGDGTTSTDGDGTATTDGPADKQYGFDPDHDRGVWGYRTNSEVRLGPAAVGDTVYVGTTDGLLHALASDGSIRWRYDAGTGFFQPNSGTDRSPTVVEGTVLFVSGDQSGPHGDGFALHAVDTESGDALWRHAAGGLKFLALLGVAGGHAFVGTSDDAISGKGEELRAVSLDDGTVTWTAEIGDVRDGTVTEDAVYVTSYSGLDAVGTDGQQRWAAEYEGTSLDPGVVGDTVAAGVRDPENGAAVGYAPDDGAERWRVGEAFFVTSLRTGDGAAFVGGEHVVAVEPDGTERWRYDPGALVTDCPVADGTLYAGSGSVVALDTATGETRWSFESPAEFGSAVAVGGDRVVVDRQGHPAVDVVNDADGSERFTYEGSGVESLGVTVHGDGLVVVADGAGNVVGLR